jgi:hypothetical protein
MKHNTRCLVLAAAVAGLGIGAISAANAQSAGGTGANSAGPPPAAAQGGGNHWGPGRGRNGRRGPSHRAGWNRRGGPPHRGGWNHRGGNRRWQRGPGLRRGRGQALVGVLLRQVRELNLSDQQRQRVRDLLTQARKQRQQGAAPALDITALGNPGSPEFARAVQDAKDRAAARIQKESQLATQVYDVLTPTQQRDLATLLAADRVRMQHRREMMQQMRQRVQQRRQQRHSGSSSSSSSSSSGN